MVRKKISRTALALAVAIGLSALLACAGPVKLLPAGLFSTVLCNFFLIAFYGWPIYLPFAFLHARWLKRYPRGNWLTSAAIGGLLATAIVVLLTNRFTPAEIELGELGNSQLLTSFVYGSGGSLYGLLYRRWVAAAA